MMIELRDGNGWNEESTMWDVQRDFESPKQSFSTKQLVRRAQNDSELMVGVLEYLVSEIRSIQKWRNS